MFLIIDEALRMVLLQKDWANDGALIAAAVAQKPFESGTVIYFADFVLSHFPLRRA